MLVNRFLPKKLSFFLKFCCKFLTLLHFLKVLSTKNTENAYFDQRFGVRSTQTQVIIYNKPGGFARYTLHQHSFSCTQNNFTTVLFSRTSKSQKSMCFQQILANNSTTLRYSKITWYSAINQGQIVG